MRILKQLLIPAAFTLASTFAGSALAEGSKIAVVDVQRALVETAVGANAQQALKTFMAGQQKDLEGRQKKLQGDKDALEKLAKAGKAPQAQIQQRAEELQRNYAEYQQRVAEFERQVEQKRGELTGPVLQAIQANVRRISAQEGYEIVLDKSVVHYFRADIDVTDKVIQLVNAAGGVTAPRGAAPKVAPAPKKK